MNTWFDESRLDDERALLSIDHLLRALAESGARVRRDHAEAAPAIAAAAAEASGSHRPRAVVAAGPDARLLRAVLEPLCPVPFVAWPTAGLPGWVGSLDVVLVLAPEGGDDSTASAVAEAERRGAQVVAAAPANSLVADHVRGRWSRLLPTVTGDPLAACVVMLDLLDRLGLGPAVDPEEVARGLDEVALANSPLRDIAANPAKETAIALADSHPVVFGGSVLAARAARRVAEAMRRGTGQAALAGETEQLLPVLESAPVRSIFDDPVDEPEAVVIPPSLLVLDDGDSTPLAAHQARALVDVAQERRLRHRTLTCDPALASSVARYASLLLQGRYVAAYSQLGLQGE